MLYIRLLLTLSVQAVCKEMLVLARSQALKQSDSGETLNKGEVCELSQTTID